MAREVTKSRLNEIAKRKLDSIGISAKLDPSTETLRGLIAIPTEAISNPLTNQSIDRVAFEVEGHDKMRFTNPAALAGLEPLQFYDLDRRGVLIRISECLDGRAAAVRDLHKKLQLLGLPPTV